MSPMVLRKGIGAAIAMLLAAPMIISTGATANAAVPEAAGDTCGTTANPTSGCARVGSFNLAPYNYIPGTKRDENKNPIELDPAKGSEYVADGKKVWDSCKAEYPSTTSAAFKECLSKGAWSFRRIAVREIIKNADLDIIALQEVDDGKVWPFWKTQQSTSVRTMREDLSYLMEDVLGYKKLNTSEANARNEIFYNPKRFKPMTTTGAGGAKNPLVTDEIKLMKDKPAWSLLTPGPGGEANKGSASLTFKAAKFVRVGTPENARNMLVFGVTHLRTDKAFTDSPAVTIDGTVYNTAAGKGTAYRRFALKAFVAEAGKLACAVNCSDTSYKTPKIPMALVGDWNSTYASEGGTRTGPYAMINEAAFDFHGPDYTVPALGSAECAKFGSSIPSQNTRDNKCRRIDHALLKVPATMNLTGFSVNVAGRGSGVFSAGNTDQVASDHRLVKMTFKLAYAS